MEIQIWLGFLYFIWQSYWGLSFLISQWDIKLDQWFPNFLRTTSVKRNVTQKHNMWNRQEQSWRGVSRGRQPELFSHLPLNPGLHWALFNLCDLFWSLLSPPAQAASSLHKWRSYGTWDYSCLFSLPLILHTYIVVGGRRCIFRYSRSWFQPQSHETWEMEMKSLRDCAHRGGRNWGGTPASCVWQWEKRGLWDQCGHCLAGWHWDLASLNIGFLLVGLLL